MYKIKEILQDLIEDKGLTPAEISRESGIPRTSIHSWLESGRTPSLHGFEQLCNYFEVSCEYLLGRESVNIFPKNRKPLNFFDTYNKILIDRNVNKYHLSKQTGIHSTHLYRWKNKHYSPSIHNVIKLADYFGITVDEMLGME